MNRTQAETQCPQVEIKDLSVRFPGALERVFQHISLSVPARSIYGIFGETGCGKSTLAQCLVGLVPRSCLEGEIYLDFGPEEKIALHTMEESSWSKLRGKKVVYVPQDPYKTLNPFETVGTQLGRICRLYGKMDAMEEILRQVDFSPSLLGLFPSALSAGQKQRAIIAQALATDAPLIIFDEPTAPVDSKGRESLLRCFKEIQERGHTLIVISHEMDAYGASIEHRFDFSPSRKKYHFLEKMDSSPRPSRLMEVRGLSKAFDNFSILDRLNLSVGLDEWVFLEGSNGSGKTTLLHILLGLLRPENGDFQWMEKEVPWDRLFDVCKHFVHVVFQDSFHAFNPRITIEKSIQEVVCCAPAEKRGEIGEIQAEFMECLEMSPRLLQRLPYQLSYGQQKRAALLRSFLKYKIESGYDPSAWHLFLFDEVFSGIHWELRNRVVALFQNMRKNGMFSIVWVAHGHDALKEICDRVYKLCQGSLIESGDSRSAISRP